MCRAVLGEGREEAVELPSEYDPITLTQYWRQRPVKIAERAATLCFEVRLPSPSLFHLLLKIHEIR
jgi:hypothetical protein